MKRKLIYESANLLLKACILILVGIALYYQIFSKGNLDAIWTEFLLCVKSAKVIYLIGVTLLMPLNWGLEAFKWQRLTRRFFPTSFFQLYKGIFMGVAISMITPNRVGEFGGRLLSVDVSKSWQAFIASAVGSFSQMLVLISVGLFGASYFTLSFLKWQGYWMYYFIALGTFFIGLMIYSFYNTRLVIQIGKKIKFLQFLKPWLRHLNLLSEYQSKELTESLFISFFRYLVYCFQYLLIMRFFNLNFPLVPAVAGIASIFLFQTSVPLPPLLGLVARGELAVFVWKQFEANEISIMAATFTLFIINLGIPSLLGIIYILKVNILKTFGHDRKKYQ